MAQEVQRVIEALARTLDRAVAIDDLDFRLIAFTPHGGAVDVIRQEAILERKGPPRATSWVRKLGVARATEPLRIPANDRLGMLARVCIPLRTRNQHLGYLWLIDPDESLSTKALGTAVVAAAECAELLHQERMQDDLTAAREREVLRDLLATDPAIREMAAADVVSGDVAEMRGALTVLVAGPADANADAAAARTAIRAAIDDGLRGVPRRGCLRLVRPDHGVVVASASILQLRPDLAAALVASGRDVHLAVGVADSVDDPRDVAAAHEHALAALRLTQVLPMFGPVAHWSELGIYALLTDLAGERLPSTRLHPAVDRLLAEEPVLAETLERFLDCAGDTRAVAADLKLHRATVYYRLDRIRELTGVDLADGEQRLGLHLSLKIHHMRGP